MTKRERIYLQKGKVTRVTSLIERLVFVMDEYMLARRKINDFVAKQSISKNKTKPS